MHSSTGSADACPSSPERLGRRPRERVTDFARRTGLPLEELRPRHPGCGHATCPDPHGPHPVSEQGGILHPSAKQRAQAPPERVDYVAAHPVEFQDALLAVVAGVSNAHKTTGRAPTLGEVAGAIGCDVTTAAVYVGALERLGWLMSSAGARALRVTTPEERRTLQIEAARAAKAAARATRDAKKGAQR